MTLCLATHHSWLIGPASATLALSAPPPSNVAGFRLCYKYRMGVEYLFAGSIQIADQPARMQGWHPHGQTGWIKPDGHEVHFICFEEQLAIVGQHVTIYFVPLADCQAFQAQLGKTSGVMPRRFPPPWKAEQIPGGLKVGDASGQALAY